MRRGTATRLGLLAALAAAIGLTLALARDADTPRVADRAVAAVADPAAPRLAPAARGERAGAVRAARTGAAKAADEGRGIEEEPRDLVVFVRTDDHVAAAGLTVVAKMTTGDGPEVVALTNEYGFARLRVPRSGDARVSLRRGGGHATWTRIEVAPGSEPVSVSLEVPKTRSHWVRVRRRGAPFLPRPFELRADGTAVVVREVNVEEGLAGIEFVAPPDTHPVRLAFSAPAAGVEASVLLPPEDGGGGGEVILDVDPAGPVLAVRVAALADSPATVMLQRWDEQAGAFAFDRHLPAERDSDPGAGLAWEVAGLPAGRYRILEASAAVASEPVDLFPRAAPTLRLDLTAGGSVRGRVVVPPDDASAAVEVWVWDGERAEGPPRVRLSGRPSFDVPIAAGHTLTLQARHPRCVPDPARGTVTVTGPRDDVVLGLVRGPTARLRVLAPDGTPLPRDAYVSIARTGTGGTGDASVAVETGGVVRFGGFEPGNHRLVLDDRVHAPTVLDGVRLGLGETDLGDCRLDEGHSVVVRVVAPAGRPAPHLVVVSEGLDGLRCHRTSRRDPATGRPVIRGLAPGRHRVTVLRTHGLPPASGLEQEVEVGPGRDAEIVIDFTVGPLERADAPPR